jgi:hypothetical protein
MRKNLKILGYLAFLALPLMLPAPASAQNAPQQKQHAAPAKKKAHKHKQKQSCNCPCAQNMQGAAPMMGPMGPMGVTGPGATPPGPMGSMPMGPMGSMPMGPQGPMPQGRPNMGAPMIPSGMMMPPQGRVAPKPMPPTKDSMTKPSGSKGNAAPTSPLFE